jgi:hypothetical protein
MYSLREKVALSSGIVETRQGGVVCDDPHHSISTPRKSKSRNLVIRLRSFLVRHKANFILVKPLVRFP